MDKIRNSVLAGLVFGLIFSLVLMLLFELHLALIMGGVSGALFGTLIYLFVNSKAVKQQTQIKMQDGKEIIRSGGANHFMKGEAVGGKLYLLKDSLQFKSHGFNIQNHELIISINEIKEVRFHNTLGLVPNGLSIVLLNGKIEKFVVNGRKSWKEEILKLKPNVL